MLGILVQHNGDEVTLRCRGKIVAGRCIELLRLAVLMRRERTVILDMLQVRTLDAAGLGLLVELHHLLRSSGRQLMLARTSRSVRRTIHLVKLDRVLSVECGHAVAA